jgi:DNA-directed RNA polymerase subunit L
MRKIEIMNIKVLGENKEMMEIEFEDESETLTQLLATQVWKEGGEAAAVREHPFIENPKIVVMGSNPTKLLDKAATSLEEQCDEFKEEFKRALEK